MRGAATDQGKTLIQQHGHPWLREGLVTTMRATEEEAGVSSGRKGQLLLAVWSTAPAAGKDGRMPPLRQQAGS